MTLTWLALAWLGGIALGAWWPRPPGYWLAVAAAGVVAAALGRRERSWRLGGALLALGALGAARLTLSPLHATPLRPYLDGPPVTVTGTVAAAPDVRADRCELTLALDALQAQAEPERPVRDAVLLRLPRESDVHYGDRLRVSGPLRTPAVTAGFSYRDYLAGRGVHALMESPRVELVAHGRGNLMQAALVALADRAEALIAGLWPAPESALMAGILLGREGALPEPLLQAFNDTGTRHIIAISGFNISLLAGWLTALLLTFVNRRVAAPIVIVLLAAYVALVGADPSVVRAGLMGGLTLLAFLAGRPGDALTGLAASALIMTAWRPWDLWESGFQLSFAATLGLIVVLPQLEAWMERGVGRDWGIRGLSTIPSPNPLIPADSPSPLGEDPEAGGPPLPSPNPPIPARLPRWLREALLVSLAAQLATLPITLATFGRVSLVAPLANLLVLPVQAPLMQLGALATVLGLIWRPAGQLLAYVAWPFAAYTIRVVEALGSPSWAAVDLSSAGALPLGIYLLLGVWLWLRDPARRQALGDWLLPRLRTTALLVGLAALAGTLWLGGVARAPDGRLHVTFLDVGQGDATLIRTPDGKWLLVDGGPDPTLIPAVLGRRLYPWQRSLDLVALTHPDEDHLAGLVDVPRRYRLGLVLDTRLPHNTPSGLAWLTATTSSRVLYPTAGARFDLGSGVRLDVLHPGEVPLEGGSDNDSGLVLRLSYGKASFLLTGDLSAEGEAALLAREDIALQSTVLKVAHHGAREGTTARFLAAVRPQMAVISVGAGNRFGHPSPDTLARLAAAGVPVWRTDQCGEVEVATDGERLWVSAGSTGAGCRSE